MNALRRILGRETQAFVLGVSDGTLTALTLTAARLTEPGPSIDATLILRIAVAASVTSCFVFFAARYTELRRSLSGLSGS